MGTFKYSYPSLLIILVCSHIEFSKLNYNKFQLRSIHRLIYVTRARRLPASRKILSRNRQMCHDIKSAYLNSISMVFRFWVKRAQNANECYSSRKCHKNSWKRKTKCIHPHTNCNAHLDIWNTSAVSTAMEDERFDLPSAD